jgi:rhodanese-related sulfurtransferase
MHDNSPSPLVDRHVRDGEVLDVGGAALRVLHTPGHTPDSVCFVFEGGVLTGDTLLIGGSGRTDFPGGDPCAQFESITRKLFALPDATVVWPAHDYRGRTSSTIGAEKATNPRLAGRSCDEYIALMNRLDLPFPERVQQALQVNQSGFEAEEVRFPSVAEVAAAIPLGAAALAERLTEPDPPVVLDVREPEEFVGELGHIRGALLVPMDMLERRLPKLAGYSDRDLVVVCRAGARSASACAILRAAGFQRALNLDGGMLAWSAAGLAVER